MKKLLFLFSFLILLSCKNNEQGTVKKPILTEKISGKDLFNNKGTCIACHQPNQKIIGPSITEIAKIYKEQNGNLVAFLKEEAQPIVDPSQYDIMKANFAITKTMTDEELKALEDYIYSFSK